MRKVIVNSTPIIVLCNIGRLAILEALYSEILIPEAVYQEVTAKDYSACKYLKTLPAWIQIRKVFAVAHRDMYRAKLHDGEVEVMLLAQEEKTDLLIIDDNAAKKTAKYLGFKVTGTMGVILAAKRKKIIPEIYLILQEIKTKGFYIDKQLESIILEEANERRPI